MKYFLTIITILATINTFAQDKPVSHETHTLGSYRFFDTKPKTEGSNYLFDKWDNMNITYLQDTIISFQTLNINVRDNTFESKISEDQVYVISPTSLKYVKFNDRVYKHYFDNAENKNRIFQVIAGNDEYTILRGFKTRMIEGKTNPVVTEVINKQVIDKHTYLYNNKSKTIQKIRLNKKDILPLFGKKKKEIEKFVKENKLSYKKDEDLKRIFKHYNKI